VWLLATIHRAFIYRYSELTCLSVYSVTAVVLRNAIQDNEVNFCSGNHLFVVFSQFTSCLLRQIPTESIKAKLQLLHIWYMCSRTEIIQIKGDCCMLASKFRAGTGAITRSRVTTRVMQHQCNTAAHPVFPQPVTTNWFVCLFVCLCVYLFSSVIYWACRSSVTSRCVVGVTGWPKAKGHMIHRNIRTTGHSATEHHFAAQLNPCLISTLHWRYEQINCKV
jgi:hypothetical protein